jgi:hypothetical protein
VFLVAEVEGIVCGFAIGWSGAQQIHILNMADRKSTRLNSSH